MFLVRLQTVVGETTNSSSEIFLLEPPPDALTNGMEGVKSWASRECGQVLYDLSSGEKLWNYLYHQYHDLFGDHYSTVGNWKPTGLLYEYLSLRLKSLEDHPEYREMVDYAAKLGELEIQYYNDPRRTHEDWDVRDAYYESLLKDVYYWVKSLRWHHADILLANLYCVEVDRDMHDQYGRPYYEYFEDYGVAMHD